MGRYRLWISTTDQRGLIFDISRVLLDFGLNIERNNEFVDDTDGLFVMRTEVSGEADCERIQASLEEVLPHGARVRMQPKRSKRIVLMATKEAHCLGDILVQHDSGKLGATICGVIANRPALRGLVERFDIPFCHVSHEGLRREEHEAQISSQLDQWDPELIVLAKYMRVLTPEFVARYPSKILNIHHSFLPAFVGANPYKQAYERGVKIIGATAHFVTSELDEGPIISQDVERVDHSYTWQAMQRKGRHVEQVVLTRALELVLDDRVLVTGNKTVVF